MLGGCATRFGVMWGPDGVPLRRRNGFDVRGSRPIANAKDNLWEIKEGAWYGWPDYSSGVAVTNAQFALGGQRHPEFVMAEHPAVEKPLMTFPKHAAIAKLDVAPSDAFGKRAVVHRLLWSPHTDDRNPAEGTRWTSRGCDQPALQPGGGFFHKEGSRPC